MEGEKTSLFLGHPIRLTAMREPIVRDYFDKVRSIAAIFLIIAGAAAIVGATLNWVTINECPRLVPGSNFGDQEVEAPPPCVAFSGTDIADGKIIIAGGTVLVAMAMMLLLRKKSSYAWLAFIASMMIGGIAISDYRGIGDLTSPISQRAKLIGDADPAIGLLLVTAGGLIGLLASVAGVAASPRRD